MSRTIVKIIPVGKYKAQVTLEDGGVAKLPQAIAKSLMGKELPGEYTVEYPGRDKEEHKEPAMAELKITVPKEELQRFTDFTDIDG